MKRWHIPVVMICSIISFAAGTLWQVRNSKPDLESHIYKEDLVRKSSGNWGSIYMYTSDSTATYGTTSMLTAVLEFLPGKQLQPPHEHAEEEFQYVISGSGTWTLNGKESPIKKGDLMYAKPWDMHGISNTSSDTLKFFVMKWVNKGVVMPVKK